MAASDEEIKRLMDLYGNNAMTQLGYSSFTQSSVPHNEEIGGTKADTGKTKLHLIDPEFLLGLASILDFGAQKYEDHNWMKGIKISRLYSAAQRHLQKFWMKEDTDEESKLLHLDHAVCNLMFIRRFLTHPDEHPNLDDRKFNRKI